jgi:VIT1/CCC1 family predicted Fe2+/Mn2+ transporter
LRTQQKAPGARVTRLGRVVQVTADQAELPQSRHVEHHSRSNSLRDVILGGQDGLVNILGIILGIIAGGGSTTVLLAAGFAAAITESISMGAVGYTSAIAQRDFVQAEQDREKLEIATEPEAERQEIREIYAAKGFEGDLLNRVVETITAKRDVWLATMMDEELHLRPVDASDIFRSAVIITIATLIGHMIPLAPFLVLARTPALVLSIGLSAVVLFGVGVYSAKTLVGDWRKSGLQIMVIGLGAAGIGFLVGRLFQATGA